MGCDDDDDDFDEFPMLVWKGLFGIFCIIVALALRFLS